MDTSGEDCGTVEGMLDIEVIGKFESYITYLINEVLDNKFPKLKTTKAGGKAAIIDFRMKKSRPKFAMLIHLMSKCFMKHKNKEIATIRDLYYESPQLYKDQFRMNSAVLDLCRSFQITRSDLGLEATSKGLVAGDLKWISANGDDTDVADFPNGMLIPANVKDIKTFVTSAQCVIVVEKDAIFQRMLEEHVFSSLGSIILITGKGYPDMATRRLLNKLTTKLSLPIFAVVDCDPHGIEIASIIKWGSKNVTSQLVDSKGYMVPDLIWLGLLPSEINSLALSNDSKIPLSENDIKKLEVMGSRLQHNKIWHDQIELLKTLGVKFELESLTNSNGPYLTSVYLKQKLSDYLNI